MLKTRSCRDGKPTGRKGASNKMSGVTIKDMVEAGILKPGSRNNVSVQYKGITYKGTLTKEGLIEYEGEQ